VTGSRSEYLCADSHSLIIEVASEPGSRPTRDGDRDALAELVLDAFRGTVDDEGEELPEARRAVDGWLARRITPDAVVIEEGDRILAMSFVVVVGGRAYIDPVATATASKRQGLGGRAVRASLHRLQDAGHREVGAVSTDGNVASARLFASLGFVRIGPWGQ